jgi:hypothetical protein
MQKISAWTIAIPLFLLSVGFIFVGTFGYAMSPERLSVQQMRDQARDLVPKPKYPDSPGGKQLLQRSMREVCTQVPILSGFKVAMQTVCTTVPTWTHVAVEPSTAEMKNYQDTYLSIHAAYEAAVDREVARISDRQHSDLKAYAKDMIQISAGVLGLITGVAALAIGAIRGRIQGAAKGEESDDEGEDKPEGVAQH